MLSVQREYGVRQPEVRGVCPPRQVGLESVPSGMEGLAKAVERRVNISPRPQDVKDLLPVQCVPRAGRQQLCEGFRAAPLPPRHRLCHIGVLDSESSE